MGDSRSLVKSAIIELCWVRIFLPKTSRWWKVSRLLQKAPCAGTNDLLAEFCLNPNIGKEMVKAKRQQLVES